MNVRQGAAAGFGATHSKCGPVVGDNPFTVVLPDIIIDTASADPAALQPGGHGGAFQRNRPEQCWQENA